mmetsp:Transcript_999/g.2326  ORF Transcript_999/g.2326 Transcript_999/m.2326 type:complete len:168 (-) Transcript_999:138-641(-)
MAIGDGVHGFEATMKKYAHLKPLEQRRIMQASVPRGREAFVTAMKRAERIAAVAHGSAIPVEDWRVAAVIARELESVAVLHSTPSATVCFERYGNEKVYDAVVHASKPGGDVEVSSCFLQTDLPEDEDDMSLLATEISTVEPAANRQRMLRSRNRSRERKFPMAWMS